MQTVSGVVVVPAVEVTSRLPELSARPRRFASGVSGPADPVITAYAVITEPLESVATLRFARGVSGVCAATQIPAPRNMAIKKAVASLRNVVIIPIHFGVPTVGPF